MPVEPRPEVRLLPEAVHGGLDMAELHRLGIEPARVLDFSVCTNPFGAAPSVRAALVRTAFHVYPDRECLALRRALSESLDVSPERILVGNGSSELIGLVTLAFVRPGDRVLVLGPTYGEYIRAASLMGAEVIGYTTDEEEDFAVDAGEVRRLLDRCRPRVVFLCNPNNPTGTVLAPDSIIGWAHAHPQTLFLVDEAYHAFARSPCSVVNCGAENILVLRSLTKDHALAGLRLGHAVGSEAVISTLARVRPPWSVNALAQTAGVEALRETGHLSRSLEALAAARDALVTSLTEMGLEPLPSAVHYFLVRVGDGAAVRLDLLRHGILVRDAASFGLPTHIRIATRRPEENACLIAALRRLVPLSSCAR